MCIRDRTALARDYRDILLNIENALKSKSSELGTFNVELSYFQGTVTLNGEVANSLVKEKVGRITQGVDGVINIDNQLKMDAKNTPVSNEVSEIRAMPKLVNDKSIQESVWDALIDDNAANRSATSLSVNNGIVSFSGDAKNHQEIDRMLSIAMMVEGVRGVKSSMTINGHSYQ